MTPCNNSQNQSPFPMVFGLQKEKNRVPGKSVSSSVLAGDAADTDQQHPWADAGVRGDFQAFFRADRANFHTQM